MSMIIFIVKICKFIWIVLIIIRRYYNNILSCFLYKMEVYSIYYWFNKNGYIYVVIWVNIIYFYW